MFTDIDHPPPPGHTADRRPHAAVIGSGLGGLAAAIRLGARGYRVSVFEKLDQPGGRASVFRQDGFTFDAGPTIITAPFILEELWALAGAKFSDDVTLKSLDPFYDLRFDDGTVMSCCADPARMKEEVRRIAPGDVEGYEQFMKESEAIYRIGFEQLGHVPFGSPLDMVKIAPDLLRLGAWRTVHQHVAARVKNPKIRMALSFHPLFIGGNPFKVTAIYSMIAYLERQYGVHFAIGGTGALVRAMAKLVERQGGNIHLDSEVAEITCEGARATGLRLADGRTIKADIVISNAETAHTYTKLLARAPRKRWSDAKLAKARYSMSLFVWYFGTSRQYADVPHHTILMGPRYRELLHDIFEKKVLAEDFRDRLEKAGAGLQVRHCRTSRKDSASRLPPAHRHRETDHTDRFRNPTVLHQGRGLRVGARAAAERLVPPQQPLGGHREPVHRRRGHPSGCRRSRRRLIRQNPRYSGARCFGLRLIVRSSRPPISPSAGR